MSVEKVSGRECEKLVAGQVYGINSKRERGWVGGGGGGDAGMGEDV
jgi:hypothetical protein